MEVVGTRKVKEYIPKGRHRSKAVQGNGNYRKPSAGNESVPMFRFCHTGTIIYATREIRSLVLQPQEGISPAKVCKTSRRRATSFRSP
jgi:hypothetical protein